MGEGIALRLPPGAEARPKPRSKKLQRVHSASDVVQGAAMKKIGPSSPEKGNLNAGKVVTLSMQAKTKQKKSAESGAFGCELQSLFETETVRLYCFNRMWPPDFDVPKVFSIAGICLEGAF